MSSSEPASGLPEDAACAECGYPLKGLAGNVCPECGQAFDPDDPLTFLTAWRRAFWAQAHPPKPWHLVLITIVTLWSLVECSKPMRLWATGMCCCWPVLLLVIPFDYLRCLLAWRRLLNMTSPRRLGGGRKMTRKWLITPLCYLLIAASAYTGWPLYLRFFLSQRALDRAALNISAGKTVPARRFYGLYYVSEIKSMGSGCWLFVTGDMVAGGGEPTGFLYCPGGPCPLGIHQLTPVWYEGAD